MISKKLIYIIIPYLIVLNSCQNFSNKPKETIGKDSTFSAETLSREGLIEHDIITVKRLAFSGKKNKNVVGELYIKFPNIITGNNGLKENANIYCAEFVKQAIGEFNDSSNSKTINKEADILIKNIQNYFNALEKEDTAFEQIWFLDIDGNIEFQSDKFLTIRFKTNSYMGGAHGNSGKFYEVFDLNSGKVMRWQDIVKDTIHFANLAETRFRQVCNLGSFTKLDGSEAYEFENSTFKLTENFGLVDDGLVFYFQPYEIAPYYLGGTSLHFKFSEFELK